MGREGFEPSTLGLRVAPERFRSELGRAGFSAVRGGFWVRLSVSADLGGSGCPCVAPRSRLSNRCLPRGRRRGIVPAMEGVAQPSGTVTLVFTDVEGSTRLLAELGQDAYREALAEHRRAVREAFGRHGGYEVDNQGDSFFYAFASAPDAVEAVPTRCGRSSRGRSGSGSACTRARRGSTPQVRGARGAQGREDHGRRARRPGAAQPRHPRATRRVTGRCATSASTG